MPLYDYSCLNCGETFEKLVELAKRNDVFCPDCGKKAKKLFSTYSIHGIFYHMSQGKPDKLVSYPNGKTKNKKFNEMYEDGGI